MADSKLFYDDPALEHVETEVVERGEADGRAWVRLAATVFYPEGGGQPADRGTIGDARVTDVQSRGSQVLHFVDRLPTATSVVARINAGWRFDLMQQHTAQHLLTSVLADRHALPTTSFHLGEAYTSIEVAGPPPGEDALRVYEAEVNDEIRADRPVRTLWLEPGNLAASGARSRGLPEGHSGAVRIVEIEGLDRNTCGGTHVRRLGEIQMIHLLDAEGARGGARIRFLAGSRVLRELRRLRASEGDLKSRLGTGPEAFGAAIEARESARKGLEKRLREMEESLAGLIASDLAREPGPLRVRHLPGTSPELLRAVAARVARERPRDVVVLVGTAQDAEASFVVQAGAEGLSDVAPLADEVARTLGARGGGRGGFRQGRGGRWPGDDAFRNLERNLKEA